MYSASVAFLRVRRINIEIKNKNNNWVNKLVRFSATSNEFEIRKIKFAARPEQMLSYHSRTSSKKFGGNRFFSNFFDNWPNNDLAAFHNALM